MTDFGGKTSIFSHPVYLFLREFSLQDFRGGSNRHKTICSRIQHKSLHRNHTLPAQTRLH
ncbi:hypothetical protein CCU03_011995 [Escherichia coli O111:NM]|nr:hypothetical protein CCU03_011995 [Escherichia coli O111:NM]